MSDQLKTRKASDLADSDNLGASGTSSVDASSYVHINNKAKCQPSLLLRIFEGVILLMDDPIDDEFDKILYGDMSEFDDAVERDIIALDDFWDRIGYSLLENAARVRLNNVVQILLKYAKADINFNFSHRKNNPLYHACAEPGDANADIVQMLLEHGFDPNRMGHEQDEPCLSCACATVNLANIRQLLKHGADVNAIGYYGNTPLVAVVKGAEYGYNRDMLCSCVQLLLEYGADPSIANNHGRLAFDHADEGSELAKLILNSQLEPILK